MSRLLIIDSNSIMNRAYYANPKFVTSKGQDTGAIFGFLNMFYRIKEDLAPDYIVAAFDMPGKTFRHDKYEEYKAGRKKMPDELESQFPIMKDILENYAVDILELEGYEADDIIGTLSKKAEENGDEVFVVSGDRDMFQLASKNTKVVFTKKGVSEVDIYDEDSFMDAYGVTPKEYIDVKALMGDASDNIKGVPGIGKVTAFKLIKEYKSIENAIANAENITAKRARENLIEYQDDAKQSKELVTIHRDVDLEMDLKKLKSQKNYDESKIRKIFTNLEFNSFLERLESTDPVEELDISFLTVDSPESLDKNLKKLKEDSLSNNEIISLNYNVVHSPKLSDRKMDFISLSSENINIYIETENIFTDGNSKNILNDFFQEEKLKFITFNIKDGYTILRREGIEIKNVLFDANLAAYLLNPVDGKLNLKDLESKFIGGFTAPEGKEGEVILTKNLYPLYEILKKKINDEGLNELLYEVEMPLTYILSDMEIEGFNVDEEILEEKLYKFEKDIARLQEEIYDLAGEEFNVNSPKQLGVILFEKLELPVIKRTKTGYSTNAAVLDALEGKHPIIEKVKYYRTISKIYSTYIVGLRSAVDVDGKIHSTFNQTLAATGRLTSTEPNLQNIPIRHEMGREIRKAFIPNNKDSLILSSDYSQIELRVLAHIAGDENMIEAFNNKIDIHTKTASEVFGVDIDKVSKLERNNAKAVNFGIVYGISGFSLSKDLKISPKEASSYIDRYFERYPSVNTYLNNIKKEAKEKGYVTTIMNRKRYIPELRDRNKMVQAAGERLAMNSPIQGSAADIIKLAMVKVYNALKENNLKSTLILQVHDELILNVYKDELETIKKLVIDEMVNVLDLKVTLVAEESVGENWYEA